MNMINIKGQDTSFKADGRTILDAALAASLSWPHQCRAGECGLCRCRLIKGEVKREPFLPGVLSQEQVQKGFVLACRTRPESNLLLELDQPLAPPPETRKATIVQKELLDDDILRLVIDPGISKTFLAGQYANLMIPGYPERSYSMANAPGCRHLEFLIKKVPQGLVTPQLWAAVTGDELTVCWPLGSAYVRCKAQHLLLIGSGTGIAPLLSIARSLKDFQDKLTFIGINASWGRSLFDHKMTQTWLGLDETNRVSSLLPPDLKNVDAHIAGSPALLTDLKNRLLSAGLLNDQIISDPFWTPQTAKKPVMKGWLRRLFAA